MIILAGCFDSTKFSNDKATNQSASGHNTKRPGKKQDIELPLINKIGTTAPGRFALVMISKIQEKYRLTGKEIPIQYIHHFDGLGQYRRDQK